MTIIIQESRELMDEMSIVDVLTKLILDADSELRAGELMVVESLGQIEHSLSGLSRREVSEYLRSMGVDEMISAVESIKHLISQRAARPAVIDGVSI